MLSTNVIQEKKGECEKRKKIKDKFETSRRSKKENMKVPEKNLSVDIPPGKKILFSGGGGLCDVQTAILINRWSIEQTRQVSGSNEEWKKKTLNQCLTLEFSVFGPSAYRVKMKEKK
jgi:hypothetical protein